MQNRNKVLMIIVAVLLCLTLISTSMLSGVFAKYVTEDGHGFKAIRLKAFGISLTVDPSALANAGATVGDPVKTDEEISVLVENLQLVPGYILDDALHISVTGTPRVNAELKITCEIINPYENEENYFPQSTSGVADTYFMPLGFTYSTNPDPDISLPAPANLHYIAYPWHNRTANGADEADATKTDDGIEEMIIRNLAASDAINATYARTSAYEDANNNRFCTKSFTAGTKISGSIESFYIGFVWPKVCSKTGLSSLTAENVDLMSTWAAENVEDGITIKFTFHIEQQ